MVRTAENGEKLETVLRTLRIIVWFSSLLMSPFSFNQPYFADDPRQPDTKRFKLPALPTNDPINSLPGLYGPGPGLGPGPGPGPGPAPGAYFHPQLPPRQPLYPGYNYVGPYLTKSYDGPYHASPTPPGVWPGGAIPGVVPNAVPSAVPGSVLGSGSGPNSGPSSVPSSGPGSTPGSGSTKTSSPGANFIPTQTKANARPRIHKLNRGRTKTGRTQAGAAAPASGLGLTHTPSWLPADGETEVSLDDLFLHFQDAIKVDPAKARPSPPHFFNARHPLERKLFELFVHQVSRCMDIFFPCDVFNTIVPQLALLDETELILGAMFSLSALMYQRIDPDSMDHAVPINYYHQTIKSIRHHLSSPSISEDHDNGIISRCLLSTLLLCVYEMFFLASDSTYVKGAVSILTSIIAKLDDDLNAHALRASLFLQVNFWTILVCDLILSLKFSLPNMFSITNFWSGIDAEFFDSFDRQGGSPQDVGARPGDVSTAGAAAGTATAPAAGAATSMAGFGGRGSDLSVTDSHIRVSAFSGPSGKPQDFAMEDVYINRTEATWWLYKALINYSITNDFNSEIVVLTYHEFETNKPFHDWLALNDRLNHFEANLPAPLRPVIYKPSTESQVYPTIFFRDELAAMINLQFKLTKISLYESLLVKTNLNHPSVQQELSKIPSNFAKLLAKDVIGILQTYDLNLDLWPISIHTIRQVARYLHDDEREYKELERLLERIISTCHFIFKSKGIIG